MKQGWEIKPLGDMCEKTSNIKWQENQNIEFEYIDLSAVSRETLKITETVSVNSTNAPSRAKKIVKTNDIIFATTRPTLKRVVKISNQYNNQICSTGYVVLRSKTDLIEPEIIFYYLQTEMYMDRMESMQRGANYPAVTDKDVKETIFSYPVSKGEQKRIVAKLDECFGAIDKARANVEKNLNNAKELFQSKLNQIFSQKGDGWEEKKLGEVAKTTAGGTPLKIHKEYYENGLIPWLRSGEVGVKEITESKMFITELGLENSSAKLVPKNSVMIAMYGATAGEVGVLKFESSTNQAVCAILPNDKLKPEFLYYYFLNEKENLVSQAVGNAQPNISQQKIKNILIPFLSIELQEKIVGQLDNLFEKTQSLESNYQQELDALDELKKSILQKAFNGEL